MRFEILKSLPAYGPMHVSISSGADSYFSEGFVVRFFRSDGTDWVGNFQPGRSALNCVLTLPDANRLLVIAGGECYLMNPDNPGPENSFGDNFHSLLSTADGRHVLADDTGLTILQSDGSYWNSERISLDGLAALYIDGATVSGLAYSPTHEADEWLPFSYQIDTRTLTGGSFPH